MKIPRMDRGERPSAVPRSSGIAPPGVVESIEAIQGVAKMGYEIAAGEEAAQAEAIRDAREKKQVILNEVESGRRAGDFEAGLYEDMETLKKDYENDPDKAADQLLDIGSRRIDDELKTAPNTEVGLEITRRANAILNSSARELRNWAERRKTQKAQGDLEAQKNQFAARAGRLTVPGQLDGYLEKERKNLYPQFEKVYGETAEKEWHEAAARATKSFVLVRGIKDPFGVRSVLVNPKGAFEKYLLPDERAALLDRTDRALENRGDTRQYELLHNAAGKTIDAVGLLNQGRLDASTLIALQTENENAITAARLDKSYSSEQKARQIKFLEGQREVIDAIDSIYARGVPFAPEKQTINDMAALKTTEAELKKYKGRDEQLPVIVEHMKRLVLMKKEGSISRAGYNASFGMAGLAYRKALKDEAGNTGWWVFQDAQEAGNREMNKHLEGLARNATEEQKAFAWTTYMERFVEEAKKGDVSKEYAGKLARNAISGATAVDVRVKGD